MVDFLKRKRDIRRGALSQPKFKRLIANLFSRGLKTRAHYPVAAIAHSPQHIGGFFIGEAGRIGERGNPFADSPRVSIVVLELQPRHFR